MEWRRVVRLPALCVAVLTARAEEVRCRDVFFSDLDERKAVEDYCNAKGTLTDDLGRKECYFSENPTENLYSIECKCKDQYILPDCSVLVSTATYLLTDELNETPNTCLLEDLLLQNSDKNDFNVYGHYVKGKAERAAAVTS